MSAPPFRLSGGTTVEFFHGSTYPMEENMVDRVLPRAGVAESVLVPVLDQIRSELQIPASFPPEVVDQAQRATSDWATWLQRLHDVRNTQGGAAPSSTQDSPSYKELTVFPELPQVEAGDLSGLHHPALPALDATHIPFITIDPQGSRDLDQALHLARIPHGEAGGATDAPGGNTAEPAHTPTYLVSYAIASVATFVPPDSPLDSETRDRGLTTYMPDYATPLHPRELSEGAASLLPDQVSPACVWQIVLGADGRRLSWTVRRALVCSRAQLTYEQVQAWIDTYSAQPEADADAADPLPEGLPPMPASVPADMPRLLQEIGGLRQERESARGGVSARVPEQEIMSTTEPGGPRYHLVYRTALATEEWNAQISLLTGMCAASLMRDLGMGVLRTVPPASSESLDRMRLVADVLKVDWPREMSYPELVRSLDPGRSRSAAFLLEATSLFRGAGYTVFGVGQAPDFPEKGAPQALHAPIAAEYAHTTAPLRRLVDRWSLELCIAASNGQPVPEWVVESLGTLPQLMGSATQRVSAAGRESLAAIEALLLEDRVGEIFSGAIVDVAGSVPVSGSNGGSSTNEGGARSASRDSLTSAAGDSGKRHGDSATSQGRNGGGRGAKDQRSSGTVMVRSPAIMAKVVVTDERHTLPFGSVVKVRLDRADIRERRIEFSWPV
ncbi:MAG: RNB domain-containing ribonuclease [Actinomycetaceae bacterium]|nr:RNB domain-containing ribonuclease [Actinomycetaceae bacterium]